MNKYDEISADGERTVQIMLESVALSPSNV